MYTHSCTFQVPYPAYIPFRYLGKREQHSIYIYIDTYIYMCGHIYTAQVHIFLGKNLFCFYDGRSTCDM